MKTISVIVPIYKVESYLPECLDSILASTYQNLEILLVDDGSPDRCGEICDEYARRDSRIRVIHQENQGLVGARNAGLRQTTGEYIAFVDSDDVISPIMYERMAAVMEQTQAEVVCCEYDSDWSNVMQQSEMQAAASACFDTYDRQLAVLTCAPAIRDTTWTGVLIWDKLYRRKKIRFPFRVDYLIGEDLMFNLEYIEESSLMAILPEKLYFYRQNPQSTMGTYNSGGSSASSARKGASIISMWNHLEQNSPVTDPAIRDYFHTRSAYMSHGGLWRIYSAGLEETFAEEVSQARRLIHDHTLKLFQDKDTYNGKIKAVMFLCRFCFPLWVLVVRLSGRHS